MTPCTHTLSFSFPNSCLHTFLQCILFNFFCLHFFIHASASNEDFYPWLKPPPCKKLGGRGYYNGLKFHLQHGKEMNVFTYSNRKSTTLSIRTNKVIKVLRGTENGNVMQHLMVDISWLHWKESPAYEGVMFLGAFCIIKCTYVRKYKEMMIILIKLV